MIKSMTGFGRSEVVSGARKIVVEIKAVNHRFCEINVKTPKKLSFFETTIRAYLKKYIERGKVDVFITYEDLTETNVSVKYNKELAEEYVGYMNQMFLYWHLLSTGAALHHRLKQRLTAFISLVFQREEKLYISKIYISLQHLLIQIRQCLMTLFMPMNSFVSYCILIREEHSFVRDLQEQMTSKIIRNF